MREDRLWIAATTAVLLTLAAAGCGGGGAVTGLGARERGAVTGLEPAAQAPVTAPLAVPGRLRAVWAPASRANGLLARLGLNTVLLQPESWADDLTSYAQWSRERGVGAIPYVGQCFEGPHAGWDACWASVERWSRPLRGAGILWGYQGLDEPALHGWVGNGLRDQSNVYIRARGFDVLSTEWIDYVTDRAGVRAVGRPPGVRWYGVTCYAYGSRTPWHVQGCAEEYARHPDWDTVVIPEGHHNLAAGYPYDQARWEAIAGNMRSIAFWSPESE